MNDYLNDLPQLDAELFRVPDGARLRPAVLSTHAPRFLLLYGSLRERSFSRLLVEEAARLLAAMGAEVRVFNPSGLPLPDDAPDSHPKVVELRELVMWSEGMVWCSPERHGAMTGIMKAQIDWIPLSAGRAPDAGQDARGDAGERRLSVVQRGEPAARARALDAHADHPEPVVGGQGVHGIRRGGADEAVRVFRSRRGRDGRTDEVHAAHA